MARVAEEKMNSDQEVVYKTYTRIELKTAFDQVCDKTNWKKPIRAVVNSDSVSITLAAIEFFTSSFGRSKVQKDGRYLVTARGYYATVGA